MSNINWNTVLEEQENDPGIGAIPKGRYPVRVKSAEAVTASTGNPMLKLQLQVAGGPYDTRVVFTNIVFTTGNPKAMSFTLRKLAALGVTREVLAAQNPSNAQIAKMVEGVEVEADIEVREYNGEDTNDVKGFKALSGGAPPAPPVAATPATTPDIPIPTIPDAAPAAEPAKDEPF